MRDLCHIIFQTFFSHTHQFVRKGSGTNTEISRIIGQWLKYLIPGNTICHHNIGCCMSLGEHILDQLTGSRYTSRTSCSFMVCDPLLTKALALTDTLHNGKGQATLHSLTDQIDHNIITCTDRSGNRCFSFLGSVPGHFPAIHQYHGKAPQYEPDQRNISA